MAVSGTPVFRDVFAEGRFPARSEMRRAQPRRRLTNLPAHANIGDRELITPRRHLSIELQKPASSFAERAPVARTWDRKWPVVLSAAELIEDFSAAYELNANYSHDPTEGPIYHAANALADRCTAFFDPIRTGQLVASGTSTTTFGIVQIGEDQWSRPEKWIDMERSDLFHKESGPPSIWWSGVKLRLPQAVGDKTSPAPPVGIARTFQMRRRKTPVREAVAECLKEQELDHDRGDMSFEALAEAIAPCMRLRLNKPYKTAADLGALQKAVSRYFSKLRK
jgi:hypothetical protein